MGQDGAAASFVPSVARTWDRATLHRRLHGTVLFVDVSGFTRLSERLAIHGRSGAEETQHAINGVFEPAIARALDAGGDVLAFGGDALLVAFEADERVDARADEHVRRAIAVAADVQRHLRRHGRVETDRGAVQLRMSAGLESGWWTATVPDGPTIRPLFAGPAIDATLAAESAASAGQVFVGPLAAAAAPDLLRRRGDWMEVDLRAARGDAQRHDEPVPTPTLRDDEYLDPRVARLVGSELAEHRLVAASFVRIVGTTQRLVEDGIEALADDLQGVARLVLDVTSELGTCWLESDVGRDEVRIIVTSGVPDTSEHDDERLLRTVLRLAEADPRLVIGANRGPMFFGIVGHPLRRSCNVMGDAMNVAARLSSRATPGRPIVSRSLLDASGLHLVTETLDPMSVKGRRRQVDAVRLDPATSAGPTPRRSRNEVAAPEGESALVGRDGELDRLVRTIAGAGAIEVVGDAGVGKSRLVGESLGHALLDRVIRAAGDPVGISTAYGAVRSLVADALDVEPTALTAAKLSSAVAEAAPQLTAWVPLLGIVSGVTVEPTAEVSRLDAAFIGDRLRVVVAELIAVVAAGRRVVVVAEDLHWFDPASRSLIDHLAAAESRSWSVVATRRPDGDPLHGAAALDLQPIDEGAARQLAAGLAGDTGIAPDRLAEIVARAEGNPLFVRELVTAIRTGATLPDRIEQLIGERIAALPSESRALVRQLSVLGSEADLDLLPAVLDRADAGAVESWSGLDELVAISAGRIRFRHDLIRAAAYEGLAYRQRRVVHSRAADALLAQPSTPPSVIARHLHLARRAADAWEWSVRAGDLARTAGAWVEAADMYGQALDVAEASGAAAAPIADVGERLGDVAERLGRQDDAVSAYGRARRLVGGDVIAVARIDRKRARVDERAGEFRAALRRTALALSSLDALATRGGADGAHDREARAVRAELLLVRSVVRFFQGRLPRSIELAELALAEAGGDALLEAQAHLQLEMACSESAQPDRAHHHGVEALRRFEALSDDLGLGNLHLNLGVSAYNASEWDRALAEYDAASVAYERAGDVIGEASARNNQAEILTDQGRLHEAAQALDDARRTFAGTGYLTGLAYTGSGRARVALRQGRMDDAHRLLDDARARFVELGADGMIVDTDLRRAEVFIDERRFDEALELLDGLAPEVQGVALLPITLARLRGWALRGAGDETGARASFEEALAAAVRDGVPFDEARCLHALGRSEEAGALFEGLGVLSRPTT